MIGLRTFGYTVQPDGRSSKYVTMTNTANDDSAYEMATVFVGMRGSVRQSPTGRLCDSTPLPTDTAQAILQRAQRAKRTKVSISAKLTRRERKKANR